MRQFYRGVLFLAIAAFVGESLEFVINIILARELGEQGLGLYVSILPTIMLIAILASAELPVSISKFIAEKERQFHRYMLLHALSLALLITVLLSILAALVLPNVPVFNDYHPYVRKLIFILIPIVSFSAVARGYFMGAQQMGKIAVANFLRKGIQLLLLVFVYRLFQFEQDIALLVAICTVIASEFVVFAYLALALMVQMNSEKMKPSAKVKGTDVRKSLLSVSIPMTGVRLFYAFTFAVKPFLVKIALMNAGLAEAMATAQFGKLSGVAFTIGFFSMFIAHSFLVVLIPTVAEASAKHDYLQLQRLLNQVMKLTLLYGIPAIIIFYFFAEPLTGLFFERSAAAGYLQLLTPHFLAYYFVMPLQAYLIGLGLAKEALWHAVWSTICSFLLMYFLGSMKSLQMDGIIIGMNMGAVLLTLMHYVTVCRKIGLTVFMSKAKLANR
ncbi:polysaccharide biosynthesis protein [Bacillus sp. HMF5848]|uniref:polysaccharide biosynthesis protein n=1 Tax=Bacillus sp. HMF5848 TaxID=2495421 RepID=UPI000F786B33|nr:polysaccharide biosynthesis protein [Bacillus sp. HMF5848]